MLLPMPAASPIGGVVYLDARKEITTVLCLIRRSLKNLARARGRSQQTPLPSCGG